MTRSVPADPYRFPLGGRLEPGNTALVVIDMQVDFCAPGGYIARMGCDLTSIRAPLAPIGRLLEAMRGAGFTPGGFTTNPGCTIERTMRRWPRCSSPIFSELKPRIPVPMIYPLICDLWRRSPALFLALLCANP